MFDNFLTFCEAWFAAEGGMSLFERTWVKLRCGMPLTPEETRAALKATGRTLLNRFRKLRDKPWNEAWLLVPRRGGKSTLGAACVAWECLTREARPDQNLTAMIISPGLRQSKSVSLDIMKRHLAANPDLLGFLTSETTDSLTFSTGVRVCVLPPDPRLVQGFCSPIIWCDEASGFRSDDALSNLQDVLDAARPCCATIPDAKILITSIPGPKSGLLYSTWNERFDQSALIFRASSLEMNPSLANSEEFRKAQKRPEHFQLYWSGEFVDAARALIPANLIEKAIMKGVSEIRAENIKGNGALGCDFAASRDDCSAALCFRTPEDRFVVPWVRNWTTKSGELHQVYSYLMEIGSACRAYRIQRGAGDQQSLAVAQQILSSHGCAYERLITNGQGSEPVFDYLREQLRAGRVDLPDIPLLRQQLVALEERRGPGSYEVTAGRGKDDLATALAAAVFRAGQFPVPCDPICEAIFLNKPAGGRTEFWHGANDNVSGRTMSFSRPPRY